MVVTEKSEGKHAGCGKDMEERLVNVLTTAFSSKWILYNVSSKSWAQQNLLGLKDRMLYWLAMNFEHWRLVLGVKKMIIYLHGLREGGKFI